MPFISIFLVDNKLSQKWQHVFDFEKSLCILNHNFVSQT